MSRFGFVGIDPGKTGAACYLRPGDPPLFYDWPKTDNVHEVIEAMKEWKRLGIRMAALEKVASMSQQGVRSVFTFGKNYGRWEAILAALKIAYVNPTPQAWQKKVGITKGMGPDPKSRSRILACNLYPTADLRGPRGGFKDGRADALLMAHYAWRETR